MNLVKISDIPTTKTILDGTEKLEIENSDGSSAQTLVSDVFSHIRTQSKDIVNLALYANAAANALTIALKQPDGTTDPATGLGSIQIAFRSTTLTSGSYIVRELLAALSLVIPSGATMGQTNAVAGFLYVYALDNAGTIELAVSGTDCWSDSTLQTTTVLDTASDSATVLYSTVARTSVPIRFLGTVLLTEATAGTYASQPTKVSIFPCSRNHTPIRAQTLRSSSTSITSATAKTVTSITLPPGTWTLRGHAGYLANGGSLITTVESAISLTTNTQPANDTQAVPSSSGEYRARIDTSFSAGAVVVQDIADYEVSIISQTTFYLVCLAVFTVSTATVFGQIEARFVHD